MSQPAHGDNIFSDKYMYAQSRQSIRQVDEG